LTRTAAEAAIRARRMQRHVDALLAPHKCDTRLSCAGRWRRRRLRRRLRRRCGRRRGSRLGRRERRWRRRRALRCVARVDRLQTGRRQGNARRAAETAHTRKNAVLARDSRNRVAAKHSRRLGSRRGRRCRRRTRRWHGRWRGRWLWSRRRRRSRRHRRRNRRRRRRRSGRWHGRRRRGRRWRWRRARRRERRWTRRRNRHTRRASLIASGADEIRLHGDRNRLTLCVGAALGIHRTESAAASRSGILDHARTRCRRSAGKRRERTQNGGIVGCVAKGPYGQGNRLVLGRKDVAREAKCSLTHGERARKAK
jgi:hypothetical protein